MGVTGLWKLIEPCGKPVPVETLEGKVLAVDISIWLHQVVKGFQDNKGAALNNAHLLGLFHRLCKLMYYRVKPVFVFDGCVPQLKRDTIAKRQQQRNKLSNEADRIQSLLLQSLAKEKVVQLALGPNTEHLLTSPVKKKIQNKDETLDDMFKLPQIPESSKKTSDIITDEGTDESFECSFHSTDNGGSSPSAEDSSYDESNPRIAYNSNLQAIDVNSNEFKQLPADVRHEILVDIKETRKQSSWGRLHELPAHSVDFSKFQMKRLLKRRQVQESLEQAEKEMGNDLALTYAELTNMFTEEGILGTESLQKSTKQISSSEHTRYLLVRDLQKKLKSNKNLNAESERYESMKHENDCPSTSNTCSVSLKEDELGKEYDAEMALAIAMSLQDDKDNVYKEEDYDYDSDEALKLNKVQRKHLKNAAKGPAAAYMIEYGGMNKEEVQGIVDKTQVNESCLNDTVDIDRIIGDIDSDRILNPVHSISKKPLCESQELCLRVSSDSDETDSDLEEVISEKPPISISVDIKNNFASDDDLFADVFKDDECIIEETPDATDNIKSCVKPEETIPDKQKFSGMDKSNDTAVENKINNSKNDILSILKNLKQQAVDIKNISLEDVKISSSVVEISDDEIPYADGTRSEIIEIFDSQEFARSKTPPPNEHTHTNVKISKTSPRSRTPSKNSTITEFYNVDYMVKRTPDKPSADQIDSTEKVKSPFFVRKTPKSTNNSHSNSPVSDMKVSKASKALFDQNNTKDDQINDEGIAVLPTEDSVKETDAILEAATFLKTHNSVDELHSIAGDIAKKRSELEAEKNRQDRMGMSITQRMTADCQELLRLFGVPYIIAPMEAEAQCAFLDIVQLTNGTITDDSDIWLFGGQTVYKNFFAQNKHVLEFRSEQIEKNFNCDRKKLIQLACLVGSDYTTGINGIGAVTAMEIIASFTAKDIASDSENSTLSSIHNVLTTLKRFRDWWQSVSTTSAPIGSSTRLALQKKLKNIEISDGFPNVAVIEAYLAPKVDDNKDAMSWGSPDVESLREFAKRNFGWTNNKTDDILMPVMKKLNEKRTQQSIRNYFNVKSALSLRQIKVSKRVQNAIEKMTGNVDSDDAEHPVKSKRPRATNKRTAKRETKLNIQYPEAQKTIVTAESADNSFCFPVARGPAETLQKYANVPSSCNVIPQRVKALAQIEASKAQAAEILKKSKDTKKKT